MTLNEAIHLFARNADVDLFNHDKIQKIPFQLYVFQSEDEGSTDFLKKIPAPKFLEIKIGVPVMLLINMSNTLVNGRVGIVTEVDEIYICISCKKMYCLIQCHLVKACSKIQWIVVSDSNPLSSSFTALTSKGSSWRWIMFRLI
jgi:hypothetical protein